MGDFLRDRGGADQDFIGPGLVGGGSVDDEVDLVVLHDINDVRPRLLRHFVNPLAGNAFCGEAGVGAAGGEDAESQLNELTRHFDRTVLVPVRDGEEDVSFGGQRVEGADLGFGVGHSPVGIDAHDLARGFHFGTKHDIDAGEPVPREDGLFNAEMGRHDRLGVT